MDLPAACKDTRILKAERKSKVICIAASVLFTGMLALFASASACAKKSWTPTLADIGELETKVQMPSGAAPLKTFNREYAGRIEGGHRLIIGVYSGSGGKISIVQSERELEVVFDGGCGFVDVKYDLTNHQVLAALCHGVA